MSEPASWILGNWQLNRRSILQRGGVLLIPVKSARLLASGQKVAFEQDRLRVRLSGLPEAAPDEPVTTIALECEGEPKQDQYVVRREHQRGEA